MSIDFSFERASRLPLTEIIKDLCCEPLSFMWENSLLAPREKWFSHGDENFSIHLRTMMGVRVRRGFMFLKRDQVLYECPFCLEELVTPVGFINPDSKSMMAYEICIGRGVSNFTIPKARLRKELAETKKRCRGIWPPMD